jgi:hypothetical protein
VERPELLRELAQSLAIDHTPQATARGYSTSVRPPENVTEQIKRDQMAAYGLQGQRLGDYELDHLILLELGGAPEDVANL